ncbi:MAG: ABC transporter ATP-binding protein [Tannerellaceae bacterium]|jgi:ABC-type lipoprotein export system ATPase subunit|nr:ABC transporter ATP-binding protein [Tannerellaceae bacterium]
MILLSGITKTYPDGNNNFKRVLCGIDLEVQAGEFIAIMGASGSGKTTLLSILGALILPDGGSYRLYGQEVFGGKPSTLDDLRNRQIGFVFQEHRLMPQLCLRDNILLPVLASRLKASDEQLEYAKVLMELTGIDSLARQFPQQLSGGEAGRTALCRALIMKPALLLADEPTGQLDASTSRSIILLLQKINRELGTTIIMVSHSAQTASAAQRILTLDNGLLS